jgi:FtsH-binding integral membrane protein
VGKLKKPNQDTTDILPKVQVPMMLTAGGCGGSRMSREIDQNDTYLLKIVKLIPAEVSAAYLAINGYLGEYVTNFGLLVLCGLILLVTCYYIIKKQTNNQKQALITSLAFIIWAANISGLFYASQQERAVLATILVLSSLFLPRLMAKDAKT